MSMNRRELFGVLGSVGAAAVLPNDSTEAAGIGPFGRSCGVRGHMTGAKAVAASLCLEGTRCVFGVPGVQNNEFWDAMKSRGLEYLLVTNEFSASIMADGAARATGDVGVFATVPGPGLTNALTGIGSAHLDSSPIVGIVTDVDRSQCARAFQIHDLPVADLMRPIAKEVIEVKHQGEIPSAISRAFRVARAGEPGPVGVVIPFPMLNATWDFDGSVAAEIPLPFDEAAYRQALGVLSNRSYRVGIYAGAGCIHATNSLAAVAELLQAPVATSVSGKGVIADSHPLAVGWGYGPHGTRTAESAFAEVDTVLAIGVRYSEVSTASFSNPCKPRVIHVDANPANLGRNVRSCVNVAADSRLFLDRLLTDAAAVRRDARPDVLARISSARTVDQCEYNTVRIHCGVDPMTFFVKLREALGPDELLFVDVTAATHWAAESFKVETPRRYFTPADNQAMGWAIPASIGAQQVRPGRKVVSVTGDGCFLMSALEMSTAARAGLPVKFFVVADGSYHYMQMFQQPLYRRTTATELAAVDYAAFAKSFGLAYNEITSNDDIAAGIQRSLAAPGPSLTRLAASYEGREIRWHSALRKTYLDRLSTGDKLRTISRIGMRSVNGHRWSD